MQRVRQALPYLGQFGWDAEVIAVDPSFIEVNSSDPYLIKTFPKSIKIHRVKAWSVTKTRRFGLGSLSMRSWFHFRKKGNELLKTGKFDLVFFSTTAFHVMSLGPYWKRKFKIPFIADIQDPWRNDFYLGKPKNERPPKFWFSYNIDKYLEAATIPKADGIISVSRGYLDEFAQRYRKAVRIPSIVLPFGGNRLDFDIAAAIPGLSSEIKPDRSKKNIIYIGRGGRDLRRALSIFFGALKKMTTANPELYAQIRCWFIGTSYAAPGRGIQTIRPVAKEFGVEEAVTEITDRLPYFETLLLLKQADLLFVPGSTDTSYTASKIYPYILAGKKLLAIFHRKSSIVQVINETNAGVCLVFDEDLDDRILTDECLNKLLDIFKDGQPSLINQSAFEKYTAESMTKEMCAFFDLAILNAKLNKTATP